MNAHAKRPYAEQSLLPAHLRSLPGIPFPRGARARSRDVRQRMFDWHVTNRVAVQFYHEVNGDLTALAGAALAVLIASGWIAFVLEMEPPHEREKLDGYMWNVPLIMARGDPQEWLTLTAHLCAASAKAGAGASQIMAACRKTASEMHSVANGSFDGNPHRYNDVVVAAMKGVRDAAKRLGFWLDPTAPQAEIILHLWEWEWE